MHLNFTYKNIYTLIFNLEVNLVLSVVGTTIDIYGHHLALCTTLLGCQTSSSLPRLMWALFGLSWTLYVIIGFQLVHKRGGDHVVLEVQVEFLICLGTPFRARLLWWPKTSFPGFCGFKLEAEPPSPRTSTMYIALCYCPLNLFTIHYP